MILLFLSFVSCVICDENSKNFIENVLEVVHKECSFDIDSPCLQPIRETSNLFEVLPPNNLALCRVKNEMFETSMATMCYLNRTEQFSAQRRHIHTEDGNNWLCGVENQRDALGQTIPQNITYFAVITHPIDRFMNAFAKKCKGLSNFPNQNQLQFSTFKSPSCYGCNSDLGCMINTIYEKSKEFSKEPYWRKFGHFYLEHFLPQTWFCPFTTGRFSIVSYASQAKRKSANDKFLGVLHKANVTYEKLNYIETELEQLPKASINLNLKEKFTRELLESEDLLRKFLHIYYFDFVYFGIQMAGHFYLSVYFQFSLKMYQRYMALMSRRPLLTQMATSAVIAGGGDLICQKFIERRSWQQYDAIRTGRFFVLAGFFIAPILNRWFRVLELVKRGNPKLIPLKRMLIDQSTFSPIFNFIILCNLRILEGISPKESFEMAKSDWWPIWSASLIFWPPVQLANFYFVPLNHRVVVTQIGGLVWNSYLSYRTQKKLDIVEPVELESLYSA